MAEKGQDTPPPLADPIPPFGFDGDQGRDVDDLVRRMQNIDFNEFEEASLSEWVDNHQMPTAEQFWDVARERAANPVIQSIQQQISTVRQQSVRGRIIENPSWHDVAGGRAIDPVKLVDEIKRLDASMPHRIVLKDPLFPNPDVYKLGLEDGLMLGEVSESALQYLTLSSMTNVEHLGEKFPDARTMFISICKNWKNGEDYLHRIANITGRQGRYEKEHKERKEQKATEVKSLMHKLVYNRTKTDRLFGDTLVYLRNLIKSWKFTDGQQFESFEDPRPLPLTYPIPDNMCIKSSGLDKIDLGPLMLTVATKVHKRRVTEWKEYLSANYHELRDVSQIIAKYCWGE